MSQSNRGRNLVGDDDEGRKKSLLALPLSTFRPLLPLSTAVDPSRLEQTLKWIADDGGNEKMHPESGRTERLGGGAVGAASSLLASFTHHARNSPLVAIQNNRRQHASPSLRARRAGRREQKALKGWRPRPREISCLIAGPSRLSLFLSFLLSQTKPHPSLRNLLEPSDGRPGSHRGRRVGRRRRRR